MNCVKEKRFLFWKYKKVEHDYKVGRISKFMDSSDTFVVDWECQCGASYSEHFITWDELLLMGFTSEILSKIDKWNWYYPEEQVEEGVKDDIQHDTKATL